MTPRADRKKQPERTTECAVCHDQVMEFRCKQCHKPVCDDCAFKIEHGAFCSRECAHTYRDFKGDQKPEPRKRRRTSIVLVAVLLVLAALAILARRMGLVPWLAR